MLSALKNQHIKAIFSDLDGTLTLNSTLTAATYQALCKLKENNFFLVIVSGRPAGWADCLMRLWPIDAMVFENGAGWMFRKNDVITTTTLAMNGNRVEQRKVLDHHFKVLKNKIPQLKLSTDQSYRLFDYAIDFAEEPPFLSDTQVRLAMDYLSKQPEITVKLSSIHINYWCGTYTKVDACRSLMAKTEPANGLSTDNAVFIGDSPNDEPLFQFFTWSVGVSNIAKFLPILKYNPRYITQGEGGAGFCELAEILLAG